MSSGLTTKEAAEALGVTRNQFMWWLYRGRVRFTRHGKSYVIPDEEVTRLRMERM